MEIALGPIGSAVLIGLVIAGFGAGISLVVHRERQLRQLVDDGVEVKGIVVRQSVGQSHRRGLFEVPTLGQRSQVSGRAKAQGVGEAWPVTGATVLIALFQCGGALLSSSIPGASPSLERELRLTE